MTGLLPHHQALLDASAISKEVADARGYWSASKPAELNGRFTGVQKRAPALVIPVFNTAGKEAFCQLRPDSPREKDGKPLKYETPAKARMVLDVPPSTLPHLGDPNVTLWRPTEGIRKADALASVGLRSIALLGVWNWRGKNEHGGLSALPDWHDVALNGRKVVLCFDSDAFQNPDVHHAVEELGRWLETRDARPHFVYLPSDGAKVGVDDYLAVHSREELVALIEDRWRPLPSEAVKVKREKPPDVPLLPTGELISRVDALLSRFLILPSRAAALAIALYVLHTWAFEAAHATPYLVIQSAVKRSGKTRLEELSELVVRAPWRVTAATEAAMFRKIELARPTLLLDEVDALFGGSSEKSEAIRGILDAGNRPGAAVPRVVGEGTNMTVVDFSVYCPKVLAGINTTRWPDTVTDRSIVIQLRRKKPHEKVPKMRWRRLLSETEPLRAALARWAAEHMEELYDADPALPDQLDDRAAEAWEPLLAIADLAGGEAGELARQAALRLSGERDDSDDSHGVLAIAAIRAILGDGDALHTGQIVTALNDNEQLPFGDYRKGDGLNERGAGEAAQAVRDQPSSRPHLGRAEARLSA